MDKNKILNSSGPKRISKYSNDNNLDINLINNNLYCKKIIKPTPEELQLHQNYLKMNLKKNYFN
jgi:hypothetical protein